MHTDIGEGKIRVMHQSVLNMDGVPYVGSSRTQILLVAGEAGRRTGERSARGK